MDKEKLKVKRQQLQKALELKLQRDEVAAQIALLEKLGQSFEVYHESENLNWINANVSVRSMDGYHGSQGDFQIDVDDAKALSYKSIKEEEIDAIKFVDLIKSTIPENSCFIVCYQGGAPELELSIESFLSQPSLFFSRPETWMISSDRNWIIEYIWAQNVIRLIRLNGAEPTLVKLFKIED